jgi:threonine synthase
MIYTDTRDASVHVDFKTAALDGMNAKTGGLFVPALYPALNTDFLRAAPSFTEIAFEGAKLFTGDEIAADALRAIVEDAYPFCAPLVFLDERSAVLELFHGPTCAFKDFGARFMARVMAHFNRGENAPLHILVATSGDTGSAVGSAFQDVSGIDVTILFPKGKISWLQEKQLSTFTGNIRSLRVDGTFDDCQKLVKTAFTDERLRTRLRLSSANSINISRLLPQSFYYISAALSIQNSGVMRNDAKITAVVPSGNFGNMTSGLIAQKMGAPLAHFIAATNENKTVPDWFASGKYEPRPSVQTLSNAMDVGAPSNFERMTSMYSFHEIKRVMQTCWLSDENTLAAIKQCYAAHGYLLDPHGAVGYDAWQRFKSGEGFGVILETAHAAKFGETVQKACGETPQMPDRLRGVLALPDTAVSMQNDYAAFREWLLTTRARA